MDVNELDRLFNFTLRHKLKYSNRTFTAVLYCKVTVGSCATSDLVFNVLKQSIFGITRSI